MNPVQGTVVAPESSDNGAYSIRFWPALLILLLAGGAIPLLYLSFEERIIQQLVVLIGTAATTLLLLLWWLMASRVPWRWRLGLLGLFFVWVVGLTAGTDPDLWQFLLLFAIPAFLVLAVLWLLFAQLTLRRFRWLGLYMLTVAVSTLCLVVRSDGGMTGEFLPQLAFRWMPTREDETRAYWQQQKTPDTQEGTEERLVLAKGDWPEFRGPKRDGVVRGVKIRQDWNENPPRLLWKHPVGPGWSSCAVVGNRLYTQEQLDSQERVTCYRVDNGEPLWIHSVQARFKDATGDGPRATPTFHKGRLYALGATGILSCLNARTGHLCWSTNILEDAGTDNIPWGMAGSPLVYDDVVVVSPGGTERSSLMAYDRKTGKRVWSDGYEKAAYSSPQRAILGGIPQILIFNQGGLSSHDPGDGQLLWRFAWPSEISNNTVQPNVLNDSSVLVSSIFVGTLRLTITRKDGEWEAREDWKSPRMKLYYNDMVVKEGHAYGMDSGYLVCLDVETGQRKWRGDYYRSGQLLLLEEDDLLFVMGEQGEVTLLDVSPKGSRRVARFQALEGKTWNHPVLAHGKLFVRNSAEIACYDVAPKGR